MARNHRRAEARIAVLLFQALSLSILCAWVGAWMGKGWGEAGAAVGLAIPFVALGIRTWRWRRQASGPPPSLWHDAKANAKH